MIGRALGVGVALAMLGVLGGYAAGLLLDDERTAIATTAPVPAESPSYPADPPVEVLPDPDFPALSAALTFHDERVGSRDFGVRVPVPDGWVRTDTDLVEAKWAPPGAPENSYLLRVKVISGQRLTVTQALEQRRDALESAVDEFDLESQTDDTFVAGYVKDSFRRLARERFVSFAEPDDAFATEGSDPAYATLVVIGREADRQGLIDLLERVTDGAERA